MSGLCSVLDTLRQSLDSDSDSENDLNIDGISSGASRPPSWHGSLQQLPTTPSTSESDVCNVSAESYLCRHCGRAKRGQKNKASRPSSLPTRGRKRVSGTKKRAHFSTDSAENSSDPERFSDCHDSGVFRSILAPSPTMMTPSVLSSLSPRDVKSVAFSSEGYDGRASTPFSLGLNRPTEPGKGRTPFKADHALFKTVSGNDLSNRNSTIDIETKVSTTSTLTKNSVENSPVDSKPPTLPPRPKKFPSSCSNSQGLYYNHQRRNSIGGLNAITNKYGRDNCCKSGQSSPACHARMRSASATRDVESQHRIQSSHLDLISVSDRGRFDLMGGREVDKKVHQRHHSGTNEFSQPHHNYNKDVSLAAPPSPPIYNHSVSNCAPSLHNCKDVQSPRRPLLSTAAVNYVDGCTDSKVTDSTKASQSKVHNPSIVIRPPKYDDAIKRMNLLRSSCSSSSHTQQGPVTSSKSSSLTSPCTPPVSPYSDPFSPYGDPPLALFNPNAPPTYSQASQCTSRSSYTNPINAPYYHHSSMNPNNFFFNTQLSQYLTSSSVPPYQQRYQSSSSNSNHSPTSPPESNQPQISQNLPSTCSTRFQQQSTSPLSLSTNFVQHFPVKCIRSQNCGQNLHESVASFSSSSLPQTNLITSPLRLSQNTVKLVPNPSSPSKTAIGVAESKAHSLSDQRRQNHRPSEPALTMVQTRSQYTASSHSVISQNPTSYTSDTASVQHNAQNLLFLQQTQAILSLSKQPTYLAHSTPQASTELTPDHSRRVKNGFVGLAVRRFECHSGGGVDTVPEEPNKEPVKVNEANNFKSLTDERNYGQTFHHLKSQELRTLINDYLPGEEDGKIDRALVSTRAAIKRGKWKEGEKEETGDNVDNTQADPLFLPPPPADMLIGLGSLPKVFTKTHSRLPPNHVSSVTHNQQTTNERNKNTDICSSTTNRRHLTMLVTSPHPPVRTRREDSTESDDVFFTSNDDSKDNFADESSSSPLRLEEESKRRRHKSTRGRSHSCGKPQAFEFQPHRVNVDPSIEPGSHNVQTEDFQDNSPTGRRVIVEVLV